MFEFRDVHAASKDEQIRAWSVEQTLDHMESHPSAEEVVCVAKMIEDFVKHGDTSGVIQSAVEEGYREGRLQVREALLESFPTQDTSFPLEIDELFREHGWLPNKFNGDDPSA